ncbi:MAG: WhiB family transcriptional regulator [Microthrixaceae bacterium]|nr:WhiB family transcriptional regulator [Microthrixaceae bacterium]
MGAPTIPIPAPTGHDSEFDAVPTALAACSTLTGELTRVFFSDELHDIARAKHICATCPVMAECLEGALARREPWGVWGGQLFSSGKVVISKRRRGRPPKTPRPDDQLPLVPIPERLRSHRLLQAV